jgi:HD-like signal output (HDOD) protein
MTDTDTQLDAWMADKARADELPALRSTLNDLQGLARGLESVSVQSLAQIILRDPFMTVRTLCLANQPRRSRLGSEVTTVEHALMLLGVTPLYRQLVTMPALEDAFVDRPDDLHLIMRLISRARHGALQAREFALLRVDMRAEEVFIAAMLHGMGEILAWLRDPITSRKAERLAHKNRSEPEMAQEEVLGFSFRALRRRLFSAWRLPELLIELTEDDNLSVARAHGVLLSVAIAHRAERGWHGSALQADYESLANLLKMDPGEVAGLAHRHALMAARNWRVYGTVPAAAWLPMEPGEWPDEGSQEECINEPEEIVLVAKPDEFRRAMDEISSHLDGSLTLHEMAHVAMRGMHEGLGLARVMLALTTPDRLSVRAKYLVGVEPATSLSDFGFDLEDGRLLFPRLMTKVQSLWLNNGNRAVLEPLIPQELRALLGREYFVLSLFVNGRPFGVFYADNHDSPASLNEAGYNDFKQLGLRAMQGFAHLASTPELIDLLS